MADTAYPIDQELLEEMSRLDKQARILNDCIPLPAVLPANEHARILDLACGPGAWVLMLAQRFPQWQMIGLDISRRMIDFARVKARADSIEHATFQVGNAMHSLPFADASLDMVHIRAIQGFMLAHDWPQIFQECWRVLRPGGTLQLVESERPVVNTPANARLNGLLARALTNAGNGASSDGELFGIVQVLPHLARQAGFLVEEHTAHPINYSAGMPAHDIWCENILEAFQLLPGYLAKFTGVSREEVQHLCEDTHEEMAAADYCALIVFFSLVAHKPR